MSALRKAAKRAAGAVLRLSDHLVRPFAPLARLLLRVEGIASSHVEAIRQPIDQVALAEVAPDAAGATAAWVADNLAVVDACLEHASSGHQPDDDTLHQWHRTLMRHGTLAADLVGRYRDRQGWIGGTTRSRRSTSHRRPST